MTFYAYSALDGQGQSAAGIVEDSNRAGAVDGFIARGLVPVSVD